MNTRISQDSQWTYIPTSDDANPECVGALALEAPIGGARSHALDTDLSDLVSLAEDRMATHPHHHDSCCVREGEKVVPSVRLYQGTHVHYCWL